MVPHITSKAQQLLRSPWLHPLNDTNAINDFIAQVNPLWSLNRIKASVVSIIEETADAKSFVLKPNRHWRGHAAGQNIGVELEISGVRCQRTYTVSSAPGSQHITITVKRQVGGKISNWMHDHLKLGDTLVLSEARGEFVLSQALPQKLLMLSAGSGITPVMAMLRELATKKYRGDIAFLHSCRTPADAIFGRELQGLTTQLPGLRLHTHYSAESGRLSAQAITDLVADHGARHTFLCGPAAFMETVRNHWQTLGLSDSLQCEHFGPAFLRREPGTAVQAQVACARTERLFDSAGVVPLLEDAEAAGLSPKYGCRIGICHTCKCKKISGTVENLLTGKISDEPNEMIQLCVSAARSNLKLDL